ncbi:WYL domain-containing protein [bacterium]|nr:WYL domain-containing protein [bacterium]
MGAAKRSLMRYRLIDEILTRKSKPYPSLVEIIDYVNDQLLGLFDDVMVSRRTIQNDLRDMRESAELGFYAPIEYHSARKGYYYSEPDYSINKLPLKNEERQVIEFVANMLARYENIPMFSNFKHITQKIFDSLNIHSAIENDQLLTAAIQFDSTPAAKGNQWLATASEAIRHYRKLQIAYSPFGSNQVNTRIFHPYILKEFRGRWYLIGVSENAGEVRTYALDRIEEMELLDVHYPLEESFDRQKYFEYSFGIYNLSHEEPEEVLLQFELQQGYYILSRPIHPTQELVSQGDNEIIVRLKLYISEDFIMEILSFGDRVEVQKPDSLRTEVVQRLMQAQKKYLKK